MNHFSTKTKKNDGIRKVILSFILVATFLIPTFSSNVQAATTRENIVSYMNSMAGIPWYPSTSLTIGGYVYSTGVRYTGMPYSQTWDSPLYTLNGVTGFMSYLSYYGGNYFLGTSSVGNDCAEAVMISWEAQGYSFVSYDASTLFTNALNNSDGLRIVGRSGLPSSGTTPTAFCHSNGLAEMSDAYALLMAGDACIKDSSNHAIMITCNYPSQHYVQYTDQIGFANSGSSTSTWHRLSTMSYDTLYTKHYVPITIF